MTQTTQGLSLPVGVNGANVPGRLVVNANGDAEWYRNGQPFPVLQSNKSDNYQLKPTNLNAAQSLIVTPLTSTSITPTVTNAINQARVATFVSPTGLNSPRTATDLRIPGSKNIAPPPAAGTNGENPQASFESSVAGEKGLKAAAAEIADKDVRDKYGDYSYPKPFPEKQDRVKFTMFRYSPKDLKVDNFKTGDVFGSRAQPKNNFGTVQLPITPQIQDTNTVSWGNDDMNAFAAMAASASYNIIKTGGTAIAQEAGAVAKLLQSEGGNASLKSAAAAYLAGEAAGVNKSFLTRVTGALINPNTELLFNAPTLRTFGFSFTMSARDPDEAKQIKKIIRFFKQGMSVKRASTGLFLKTPNIFDIKYILGDTDKDHPWINQIKTCALTSCSVNYTPAGNYATFYDGAMSAYEMTLSFTELDPVFEDDYASDNDTTIGY